MTIRRISRALGVAASTAVAVLMLLMVTDVAARAVLGVSVPGLIEVAGSLMVVAVFLGLAVGQRNSGHIRVKMLTDRLPTRLARPVRTGALTVSMALLVVMLVGAGERTVYAWSYGEVRYGLLAVPTWPGRLAVCVGVAALLLEMGASLDAQWRERRRTPTNVAE
jgi:TRAP-type C4-dicarboxylate transport system permease small subunit